VTVDFVGKHQK